VPPQLEEQFAQERTRDEARVEEVRKHAAIQVSAIERDLHVGHELAKRAREHALR
jgi:hypothetical protein